MGKRQLQTPGRKGILTACALIGFWASQLTALPSWAQYGKKSVIALRGASAAAPEHTLEAYRLAVQQGADYIHQDLQVTKDGVLVCVHDLTLERTTNVEEVFPDRSREVGGDSAVKRSWFVYDFTLEEVKRLDAGSWFDEKFKGAQVPTWREAIREIRGRAGLFPEMKTPEVYALRGFNMEELVLAELENQQLELLGADPLTPVVVHSMSAESLQKMAGRSQLPRVLQLGEWNRQWISPAGLQQVKSFAAGIAVDKHVLRANPSIVKWAHSAGLSVAPFTFRSSAVATGFWQVREEMAFYLYTLEVDAVFTDDPASFQDLR